MRVVADRTSCMGRSNWSIGSRNRRRSMPRVRPIEPGQVEELAADNTVRRPRRWRRRACGMADDISVRASGSSSRARSMRAANSRSRPCSASGCCAAGRCGRGHRDRCAHDDGRGAGPSRDPSGRRTEERVSGGDAPSLAIGTRTAAASGTSAARRRRSATRGCRAPMPRSRWPPHRGHSVPAMPLGQSHRRTNRPPSDRNSVVRSASSRTTPVTRSGSNTRGSTRPSARRTSPARTRYSEACSRRVDLDQVGD